MAPEVQALAQSESKAKFMARLELNERNPEHKHLYHMMKVSILVRGTFGHGQSNSLTNLPGRGQRWTQQDHVNTKRSSKQ